MAIRKDKSHSYVAAMRIDDFVNRDNAIPNMIKIDVKALKQNFLRVPLRH